MQSLKRAVLFVACLVCSLAALAQGFPAKPVRIVVPYPPGGALDVLARAFSADLTAMWSQPVVVENIPGAASIVGTDRVAKAPADGYTLLMTTNPTVVGNRFLYAKLPFDPDKDLAPVTIVAKSGQLIVAHSSLPANNLTELVALAKKEPGKIPYGSYGNGTQPQLLLELIKKRAGIDLLHVPYKGIAPAITAVTAGEVMLTVSSPAGVAGLIRSGKLKALAIADPKRSREFPDVPTTAEQGFPYAQSAVWFGVFAPAGTPSGIVDGLHRDFTAVAQKADFRQNQIEAKGFDLVASTPQEAAAVIRSETAATGEMVTAAGIKPE